MSGEVENGKLVFIHAIWEEKGDQRKRGVGTRERVQGKYDNSVLFTCVRLPY